MEDESHLHLNDSFVEKYGWYCWNAVLGQAEKSGSEPTSAQETVVRHVWDNTDNDQPQKDSWKETTTTRTTARLATTTSASVTLSATITVYNVASSGFTLSVGTEQRTEDTTSRTEEVERKFDIVVGPHEKLELLRTKTEMGQVATYDVPYGLSEGSMVGTQGEKYDGHYHWGFYLNGLLDNPRGRIQLMGVANSTNYLFKLKRTKGQGPVTSSVRFIDPSNANGYIAVPIEDSGDSPNDLKNLTGEAVAGF